SYTLSCRRPSHRPCGGPCPFGCRGRREVTNHSARTGKGNALVVAERSRGAGRGRRMAWIGSSDERVDKRPKRPAASGVSTTSMIQPIQNDGSEGNSFQDI